MSYLHKMEYLIEVIQELSLAKNTESIVEIVRHAARELTGADGATFVLRDGEKCYYVDEDAISPLWKGSRFPIDDCVSGWAMKHKESVLIPDIYHDGRIPIDLYEPTFVRSLLMVPIRTENPIGAIGNYWSDFHMATAEEVRLLELLANSTSIAMENVSLYSDLERQLQHRDEFLSIAAHEIKTPITPLDLRIQQIQKMISENEEIKGEKRIKLKKFADISRKQISDIIRLMDNFLDVSRIRLDRFVHNPEKDTNLKEIIMKLVEQYRSSHDLQISCHFKTQGIGMWDPVKLQQLIHNLLSNAIRYGEGKPIEVHLIDGERGRVRVAVQDHGPGIAKKDQEKIFQRFERGNSSVNYGGMGLGLFVARQIVKAHNGAIWIESTKGEGTTFWVELPRE